MAMVTTEQDEDLASPAQFGAKMRKLHDWERLTAGEVEDVARVRGFADRYEKAAQVVPRDMLDERITRDLFVQDITGATSAQLKTKGPQLQVAKGLFGLDDPSDAAFDEAMRGYVADAADTRDRRKQAADAAQVAAIQGRPLREILREQQEANPEKWKEIEPVVRGIHGQVAGEFEEESRQVARQIFETQAQREGVEVENVAAWDVEELATYGRMDQAMREEVLMLVALQADAEGEDVEGYFRRLSGSLGVGFGRLGQGMAERTMRNKADRIRKALEAGKRVRGENVAGAAEAYGAGSERLGPGNSFQGEQVVEITPEERTELERVAAEYEGEAVLAADIRENGVRVKRMVDEKREGFWDTVGDWSVLAAESVPMMASMALPYGVGVMDYALTAAEENRASLRAQTGNKDLTADQETLAMVSGLTEAGVEKLQWMTLGARVPRLKAALLRRGKLGAAGVFGGRVGAVTALETGQEVVQNLQLPLMQEVAGALGADVPEVAWGEVLGNELRALPDTFGVSLVFGVIGGMGSTSVDYLGRDKVKAKLEDLKGLELDGIPPEKAAEIAEEAATNPRAAAEELKAVQMETSPEERAENAARAMEAQEREALEAEWDKERANMAEVDRDDDGTIWVVYPDGRRDEALNEDEAIAAVRSWELDETADMAEAAREAAAFIEESHEGNPEISARFKFTGRDVTLAEWAGDSKERLEQARARVRILMRQEGLKDADTVPDEQLPLGAYLIRGESRNFGGAATRIAMEIHKKGSVDVVVEEHAEGVAKWMLESGKMTREEMVRNIQATEKATGRETLQDPNDDQQLVEAFSRLAVANFFGKVPETRGLSAKFKAVLRAFAEAFSAILDLARGIREIQMAGQMDENFERWLDVAGGVDVAYRKANLDRQMQEEMMAEGFASLPPVTQTLRGKIPHPVTLKQAEKLGMWEDIEEVVDEQWEQQKESAPAQPASDRITFSIARADSPLLAAIEAQAKAPARKAAVYARMRDKVAEVRKRFEARRYSQPLTVEAIDGDDAARFEVLRDMAMLEAMAKALPPEIRGKVVGSFRKIEALKTTKARENYLVNLLPRVEKAMERHLDGLYRQAIRKVLDKGSPKVSESRKRGGKIGATGHAIFAEAKRAMTLEPAEAEAASETLTARIEGEEEMGMDLLDELEGKRRAIELFHDYENADSVRLEQALGFIENVYSAGREEWLTVLMERKNVRSERVQALADGLGYKPGRAGRAAAVQADKGLLKALDEEMMAQGLSGAQMIRRLAENTDDPAVKALVEEMERAFQEAEANESDFNLASNEALAQAMRRIFGIKGKWLKEWELTAQLKDLADASKNTPVTTIEGRKRVEITVPIKFADALLRGEISGYDYRGERVEVNRAQLNELEKVMERLEELPEEKQRRTQVVRVETTEASGGRLSLGQWSQLDGLQLWLTLRQADQREKLEAMGFDQQTRTELDHWLKPEVKELGLWMAEQLEQDQGAIDALHRSEKGVGLALVDHYFPVRNDVSRADTGGLALDGGQTQQSGRSVAFIMERITNRAEPAKVNALAVYLGHRAQQNFWRSHVTAMREWGGVIRDERFSAAVKATMGDRYYQALVQRLERIEGGGRVAGAKSLGYDRLLKAVMRRFAMGTLGMRLSTLMVNTTAALNVFLEHDARDVWAGMVKAMKRPEAFKDAWNSPAIRRRLEEGATFEAKLAKSHGPGLKPVVQQLDRWAEAGVAPINYIDTGANLLGAASIWELTRTKGREAGLDEEAARAEADAAVERLFQRAAQPTQRLSRSEMELRNLENPLAALFALFVSEPRKNLAIAYLGARELLTGKGIMGKRQAAQATLTSLVAMIAMEYAVRTLYAAIFKADEDDEDEILSRWWEKLTDAKAWTHRIMAGHLVGIPVWGQGLEYGAAEAVNRLDLLPGEEIRVFNTSPNPLMRSVGQAGKGLDVLTGNSDAVAEDTVDVVQALSPVPGMPFFSQLANSTEPVMGFWKGKISREARIERAAARFRKLGREFGKVQDEDGKLDKERQAAKDALLLDWIRSEQAGMPAEMREGLLEALKLSERLRKQL